MLNHEICPTEWVPGERLSNSCVCTAIQRKGRGTQKQEFLSRWGIQGHTDPTQGQLCTAPRMLGHPTPAKQICSDVALQRPFLCQPCAGKCAAIRRLGARAHLSSVLRGHGPILWWPLCLGAELSKSPRHSFLIPPRGSTGFGVVRLLQSRSC